MVQFLTIGVVQIACGLFSSKPISFSFLTVELFQVPATVFIESSMKSLINIFKLGLIDLLQKSL